MREQGYVERDNEALDEARTYEQKKNGSYGAKEGRHDDIIMTRMIGIYVCYTMPIPVLIDEKTKKTSMQNRTRSRGMSDI